MERSEAQLNLADILEVDRSPERASSLHRQLYAQLRRAILDRVIREGARLPASRTLARDLGVSRNTIVAVYDQMIAEGFLVAVKGAGTFVSDLRLLSRGVVQRKLNSKNKGARDSSVDATANTFGGLNLFAGMVDPDYFPYKLWNSVFTNASCGIRESIQLFDCAAGYTPLRDAIARHLAIARGVIAEADQIFITGGTAQSLYLVSRALAKSGDVSWVEEPGYSVASAAFRLAGLDVRPIPVDSEGVIPSARWKQQKDARLIYATTSYQYPLGYTMSIRRRLDILDIANKMGAWIIEDDYDGEFRYQGNPVPALFGLLDNNRTIYLGTFSKSLSPALRTSYVIVPKDLSESFRAIYPSFGNVSAIAIHCALAELISKGHFARHIDHMTTIYGARREALKSALHDICNLVPSEIESAPGGLHIPVRLKGRRTDNEISENFTRFGLGCPTLSECFAKQKGAAHGYLLGFTSSDEHDIVKGVGDLFQLVTAAGCELALDGLTSTDS